VSRRLFCFFFGKKEYEIILGERFIYTFLCFLFMEIIFVRHAETKNNVDGIIQGPEHGDINENGEKEIERVSHLLKDEKIDIFYSSDIPRCKITSERINKFHKLKINFTELIREKYNGDWTGKNYKMLAGIN